MIRQMNPMPQSLELTSSSLEEKQDAGILGQHLLLELYECDRAFLNEKDTIQKTLETAAREAGATVVESVFHHFNPHGISGIVVIAESHITIHTWPEHGYAALDIFTCGHREILDNIKESLILSFSAKRSSSRLINRGIPLSTD